MSTPEQDFRADRPPESIARILDAEPDIAEAVRKLRARKHSWAAIEGAVLWSESEGRLSVQRVRDRTWILTKQPDLIKKDWPGL